MTVDKKTERRMNRHFFTGIIEPKLLLTPIGSVYRCWKFKGGQVQIAYTDIYFFGIRIVRRRV